MIALCESAKVGLPWPSLLSFVRISTNPRVFNKPDSIEGAWSQVGQWLESPSAWIPTPTDEHLPVANRLVRYSSRSEDISDMHLAALDIEHGLMLCSTDSDFLRYEGLNFSNPLAESP